MELPLEVETQSHPNKRQKRKKNLHNHTVHTSVSLGSPDDPGADLGADPVAGGWGAQLPCDFGRPSVYQL